MLDDLTATGAQHARGIDIDLMDVSACCCTVPSVNVKTTPMKTTKMAAPSPIPKATRGEGDPGDRGDRRQQGDRGEHELAEDVDIEGETADEQGGDKRQEQPDQHALQAGDDRGQGDEIRPDALHANPRQEELGLLLDFGDEQVGRR